MNSLARARQRGSRSHETGCVALIQAHGERHPQSAKRSTIYTLNNNNLSIMYTLARARQRGSRSRETGCEALIQAHGERHPQSAKRSTIYTLNNNNLSIMYTPAQATPKRQAIYNPHLKLQLSYD